LREVLADIDQWRAAGLRVVLAKVVDVAGSAPRGPGATMAVSEDGRVSGSVSGGCVEGAVLEEALEILRTGGGPRVTRFGYSDADAFSVGLTCGGTISILLEQLDW
jgi:xanthine dehydrogenase accessory factor